MPLFKIYVVATSPSVPANVRKNLHENNLNMQIFLFLKQSFSEFLDYFFFLTSCSHLIITPKHRTTQSRERPLPKRESAFKRHGNRSNKDSRAFRRIHLWGKAHQPAPDPHKPPPTALFLLSVRLSNSATLQR